MRQTFVKLKLTYKRNSQTWHEKTMCAPSHLNQLMALYQPLSLYGQNVERRRWNLGKTGTPNVGVMVEQILQRGDYRKKFTRDLMLYAYYQNCWWVLTKQLTTIGVRISYNWNGNKITPDNQRATPIELSFEEREVETNAWPDNRMLETIKEAVRATLALPMDLLVVHVALTYEPKNKYANLLEQWMRRWSLG
ncbi:hypothetical protein Cgig2_002759 [Carnegiea gigantea]|uniref:Uncharacterized protein n=1 Tax=Carnegiea gigantea TaxID=171969 RepID=A0A9Q1JNM9_9CARY|nr:hypothetical protein Cgig2_002759 [Carnegiea gigantea]